MSKSYYKQKFYVFYDENDNIRHCGTAKQLVADGIYKNVNVVQCMAHKTRKGLIQGSVVVLK